jgi:uncharacterized protein (DUF1501 family)
MNERELTRRTLLKRAALASAGVAFWPFRSKAASPNARAKSVIQIWMWGGPSHIDTFDPKPDAGYDYCGPLDTALPTNVDGIQIGSSLPELAKLADKYTIIRSMTHGVNAHETASYMVQTGRMPDRNVYPAVGAVVSRFKGVERGYDGLAPPYVVLTRPQGRFSEAGFLGQRFKPFATGGDPSRDPFAVEGIVAPGISDERQHSRRYLLHSLDALGQVMTNHPEFTALDETEEAAYDLMFGEVRDLFDLTLEKPEIRERYGRNKFGQSCLMARRLVEAGTPYVTINYEGWDTHKQHFQIMQRKLPELDQGMSALLQDLDDHGLLDSTIVWWGGEFGRTPRVQWNPPWNGGRGHFGHCFSSVVAGGGFKGGHVLGASNATGEEVEDRPVSPQELIGSIYSLLGIDTEAALPNERGLDVKVLPKSEGGGRLTEIIA